MAWPERVLDSWDAFLTLAKEISATARPFQFSYLFRGQTDASHRLVPSLHRVLPDGTSTAHLLDLEKRLMREFSAQAHLHLPASQLSPTESVLFERWALMRHYGVPTRILDWTFSPYVAAYFAVESQWDRDGAIWSFHSMRVMEHTLRTLDPDYHGTLNDSLNPDAPAHLSVLVSQHRSPRLVAQQGTFTVCLNISGSHEGLIDEACSPPHGKPQSSFGRLIIPAKQKPHFLRQLMAMNVTAASLFPGIDGLGRSMTEQTKLAGVFPPWRENDPNVAG